MRKESRAFLQALMAAPSPSGYEGPVRQVWTREVARYADHVRVDVHGNAIGVLHESGRPRVMLAGHMDELGLQIAYIADNGYLHFNTIGGFDRITIPGRKVRIHTAAGPVLGVTGRKAIHLMNDEDRRKVPEIHELWIDIGAKDADAARKLVAIGDPVTYDPNYEEMPNDLAVSRGFDDKMGAWVVAETLRRVGQASKKEPAAAVFAVATVQEEIGLRGARTSAFGIDPLVGIAVDVTHASDQPDIDKRKVGDIKLGAGPVIARGANISPIVFQRLVEAADKAKIPYQVAAAAGGTGTDANAIQLNRAGVATGLLSVPLRYMHTPVEVLSLKDLDHAADLLAAFILAIDEKTGFVP
jgi:endoglucanase